MANDTEITLRLRDLMSGQLDQVDAKIKGMGTRIDSLGDAWRRSSRSGADAFLRSFTEMNSKMAILERMGTAIHEAFGRAQSARDELVKKQGASMAATGALNLESSKGRMDLMKLGYSGERLDALQKQIHFLRNDFGEYGGFDEAVSKSLADGYASTGNLRSRVESGLFNGPISDKRRRELMAENGKARVSRAQMEAGKWLQENGGGGAPSWSDYLKQLVTPGFISGAGVAIAGGAGAIWKIRNGVAGDKTAAEAAAKEAARDYAWASLTGQQARTPMFTRMLESGFNAVRATARNWGRAAPLLAVGAEVVSTAGQVMDNRAAAEAAAREAEARKVLGPVATGPAGATGWIEQMARERGIAPAEMLDLLRVIAVNTANNRPAGGF